jgi:hypothetical protein
VEREAILNSARAVRSEAMDSERATRNFLISITPFHYHIS